MKETVESKCEAQTPIGFIRQAVLQRRCGLHGIMECIEKDMRSPMQDCVCAYVDKHYLPLVEHG